MVRTIEMDSVFQNNLMMVGTIDNPTLGAGNATLNFNFDTTTLTLDHNVWPSQSSFTAYGNSLSVPAASPVNYYPTTSYCTGAVPTSSCVGFSGSEYLNASSLVITPADYHDLKLDPVNSVFAAGNADQASDGTDMGANIALLDYYQTLNQYPGFYPDTLPPSVSVPTNPAAVILSWNGRAH